VVFNYVYESFLSIIGFNSAIYAIFYSDILFFLKHKVFYCPTAFGGTIDDK
jgi:hypothetical protein